jgi:heptosyltransferase-2
VKAQAEAEESRMRIVVACPNWIGDAVMATPALAALKAAHPDSRITLVARPYVAPVFEAAPYADEIIPWGPRGQGESLWRLARWLRQAPGYEVGVLLTNSFRSALLFYLGRVRHRIGYARELRSWLLTDRLEPLKEHGRYVPTPTVTYYFDLVRRLGAYDQTLNLRLYTTAADEAAADRIYAALGLDAVHTLVLAPGAAFGLAKCWPAERFAAVAREARSRLGLGTLVLCAPKEMAVARTIVATSGGAAVVPVEPPPLAVVKAVVRRARAMVTNDSGLRHFAAAFDIPVVTIFGPTHINWTETWFPKETKLQASVDCGPCQKRVCPEGHLQCMNLITPEQVFAALAALVEKHPYAASLPRAAAPENRKLV